MREGEKPRLPDGWTEFTCNQNLIISKPTSPKTSVMYICTQIKKEFSIQFHLTPRNFTSERKIMLEGRHNMKVWWVKKIILVIKNLRWYKNTGKQWHISINRWGQSYSILRTSTVWTLLKNCVEVYIKKTKIQNLIIYKIEEGKTEWGENLQSIYSNLFTKVAKKIFCSSNHISLQ